MDSIGDDDDDGGGGDMCVQPIYHKEMQLLVE